MLLMHPFNSNWYFDASGKNITVSDIDPADITQYWDALFDM
jgi:hypothetical protein